MELKKFEEIIIEFVEKNFCSDGCRECHEIGHSIIPDDFKGSWDKSIKELFEEVKDELR